MNHNATKSRITNFREMAWGLIKSSKSIKEGSPDIIKNRHFRKRLEKLLRKVKHQRPSYVKIIRDLNSSLERLKRIEKEAIKKRKDGFGERFSSFLRRNDISVEEYCELTCIAPNTVYRRQRGFFGPTGEIEIYMDLLEDMERKGIDIRALLEKLKKRRIIINS